MNTKDKYWELKLIMAVDDVNQRTPVWCMHYPIPCEDCDLKSRCLTAQDPEFTWEELGEAGTSCLTQQDLDNLIASVKAHNAMMENFKKKEE